MPVLRVGSTPVTTTVPAPRRKDSGARGPLADVAGTEAGLRRFLHGLPGVDQVGLERRSAALATRSIKARRQAARARPGHLDDRPDHAGGRRHPGQGPLAVRPGPAPGPGVRRRATGRRGVPLPRPGPGGRRASARLTRRGGRGGHRVPVRPVLARGEAGRHRARRAGRGRRDRHGDRPRRLPGRPLRRGARGDRGRTGGLRRPAGPPQGHPGDRRAGQLRRGAPGVVAGPAGRRRRDQDLDRQDLPSSHAAGGAGDAAGGARLAPADRRAPRGQGGRRASAPPRTRSGTWSRCDEIAGPAWLAAGAVPVRGLRAAQRPAAAAAHPARPGTTSAPTTIGSA